MQCDNCMAEDEPAYTLRAHVDHDGAPSRNRRARTDGGASPTVDLRFCSVECLRAWT